MSHLPADSPASAVSGLEPQLGGADASLLSGFEPLLGGSRRAPADLRRVQAVINAAAPADRQRVLDEVTRLGQARLYAEELAQVVPARARQKTGSWRGTFTPSQRVNALLALALIGSYESIAPLVEALSDAVYEVRTAAAAALRTICARLEPDDRRTRIVYRALVDALRLLPLDARKVVARILAAAPPDLVLGALLRDGLGAGEWWARREAAWVLGVLGDARATRALIDALRDPSTAVRASAAWALGQLDAPPALAPLDAASRDPDEVVRAAAVEALGAHAARRSPLEPDYHAALERIIEALRDYDLGVRHAAFDALAALDSPQVRQLLAPLRRR
jgi:HEAT repeat protein